MSKFVNIALCILCIIVIAMLVLGAGGYTGFRLWQKEWIPQGETDLRFRAATVDFTHKTDLDASLPFMAAAAIDIDGDGQDEVFLGGGKNQNDALLKYDGARFINVIDAYNMEKKPGDATMGAASLDLYGDGYADLVVARESGLWLHNNTADGITSSLLPLTLAENTTPLSVAFGDVNKDGWADMYISGYLKKELVQGETIFSDGYGGYSYLFINNGDNSWRDASEEAGIWRQHNTFTAIFTDLDNDRDSDLVIAQDTGLVEIYENPMETGAAFPLRRIENPSVNSYPMGVAAGDYDNDGLIDLFFSNVGYTLPPALLRGDLPEAAPFNPEYMLFSNNDGFQFTDISKRANTSRLGFGWGVVFSDMDLDGHEDLIIAQNYARFPAREILQKYPGKLMLYTPGDEKFHPVEKVAGVKNKHFSVAPVISDFNGDGWPDLFWANLDGASYGFISKGAGDRNWLKVRLANNAEALGAIVTVKTTDGRTLTKQFMTSQGLGSDQTREMIFGLGGADGATSVSVVYQTRDPKRFENIEAGRILDFSD